MNHYKIYENPLGMREAVKQGWSWPAFFFGWIWAFVKKMNIIGGITLAAVIISWIVLTSLEQTAEHDEAAVDSFNSLLRAGGSDTFLPYPSDSPWFGILTLGGIALQVVFGVKGNQWRENNLLERGYVFKGDVAAGTDEGALGIYLGKQQASNTGP